ncbi:MAG: VOC family protein [Salinivirgaceae bacterium]|jgi:catechol 2,3-dioxygenase-like lactoylglutathione lyase family enzyme|nr:VOC family protein [Salinivirgaceae bacterium]
MKPLKYHSSVLFVSDIQKSKSFYTEILGCTIEQDFGTNVSLNGGLSLWQVTEGHLIDKKGLIKSAVGNKGELYFETEDIKECFVALQNANITFLHELHEEPWGQFTIRFFDLDNHLIEIGESLETFISRMFNSGMDKFGISDKTGIPVNIVSELLM